VYVHSHGNIRASPQDSAAAMNPPSATNPVLVVG